MSRDPAFSFGQDFLIFALNAASPLRQKIPAGFQALTEFWRSTQSQVMPCIDLGFQVTIARMLDAGQDSGSSRPKGVEERGPDVWVSFLHQEDLIPMNESKSKKVAPLHAGFEWAGAMARVRRGAVSNRAGRRGALLSMLTAAYVNTSRNGRATDRSVGER